MDQSNLIVPRHLRIPLAKAAATWAYHYLIRHGFQNGVISLREFIGKLEHIENFHIVGGHDDDPFQVPDVPINKCPYAIMEQLLTVRDILNGAPLLVPINLDFGDTE